MCAKWMRAVPNSLFFVLTTLWSAIRLDDEPGFITV